MDQAEEKPRQADISRRAVSLGRYIDRLPEGEYMIKIQINRRVGWSVEVSKPEKVKTIVLDK